MSRASFASLLAAHPGTTLVHWPGGGEPSELRPLPRLGTAAGVDLVITADTNGLEAALGALRPGGTVALVAPAGGLLALFGGRGPDGPALAERLLGAGLVELGMAIVPGALQKWWVVWAERPATP